MRRQRRYRPRVTARPVVPVGREPEPVYVVIHQMRRAGFDPETIAQVLGWTPREVIASNLVLQRVLRAGGISDDQAPTPVLDRCRRKLRARLAPRIETPPLHLPGSEVYETFVTGS